MKYPLRSSGFSMIELLVVVALIAVVGLIALPSLVERSSEYRQSHAVSLLIAGLESAKMQAISQDLEVEVAFSGSNNTFRSEADLDGSGMIEADEITSLNLKGIQDVTVVMPASTGTFTPLGQFSSTESRWLIQIQSADAPAKYIYVFPSGHIRQSETTL